MSCSILRHIKNPSLDKICDVATEDTISMKGFCGQYFDNAFCRAGRQCTDGSQCKVKTSKNADDFKSAYNKRFSMDNLPQCKGWKKKKIELEEYDMFEENTSGYSGSDLLIAVGAGIFCGVLGSIYVKRNEKSLYY